LELVVIVIDREIEVGRERSGAVSGVCFAVEVVGSG
jgi:hypothetical protein